MAVYNKSNIILLAAECSDGTHPFSLKMKILWKLSFIYLSLSQRISIPPPPRENFCQGFGEFFDTCPDDCVKTCQSPLRGLCQISFKCQPQCVCEKGYLRDEVSGKCVKEDQCFVQPACPKYKVWNLCTSGKILIW